MKYCIIVRKLRKLKFKTYQGRGKRNRRIKFYCELITRNKFMKLYL